MKPIIFLAFANDQELGHRYLRNLPDELRQIRSALQKAENAGLCEIVERANASIDDIFDVFQRQQYRGRISLFHYGGHANSYKLLLENKQQRKEAANSAYLNRFLASQKGLDIVFLNACSTQLQGQELIQNGVPTVISTDQAIQDEVAKKLAVRFYMAIGQGQPLRDAWQNAIDNIETHGEEAFRGLYREPGLRSQMPWQLQIRPGAEDIENWNLPQLVNNPLYGLPTPKVDTHLPNEPFRLLARYTLVDHPVFFGRNQDIRSTYQRITSTFSPPIHCLYGQSGVGKSSFIEAGIVPYLAVEYQVRHTRRDKQFGLAGTLLSLLHRTMKELAAAHNTPIISEEMSDPRNTWITIEQTHLPKALILIIDQVEEVFTHDDKQQGDELNEFFSLLSQIFGELNQSPKGKVILSYRKEFHSDIIAGLKNYQLPYQQQHLARIDKAGILEIVNGLNSKKELRSKYQLRVEPGLAELIADQLLLDQRSPIAPILQIILSKLWAGQNGVDQPFFSLEAYRHLQKQGILLTDFFRQQMEDLQAWAQAQGEDYEQSGLALDLLHYHTTSYETAGINSTTELQQVYAHQENIIGRLVTKFQSLYLLTKTMDGKSTLAHDTLAPIIRKEMKESARPGQIALRILENKMIDYQLAPDKTALDKRSLSLVEKGKGGMRVWMPKEKALIEKSRQRRSRNRAYRWILGLFTLLFILSTVIFFWQRKELRIKDRLASYYRDANFEIDKKQFKPALEMVKSALTLSPDDPAALQLLHEIYSENEFPLQQHRLPAKAQQVIWADTNRLLLAYPNEIHLAKISLSNEISPLEIVARIPVEAGLSQVAFHSGSGYLFAACGDHKIRLWDVKMLQSIPTRIFSAHTKRLRALAISRDGNWLISGGADRKVIVWDIKNGSPARMLEEYPNLVNSVALSADGQRLAIASNDQMAWGYQEDFKAPIPLAGHTNDVLAVAIAPENQAVVTAGRDNQVIFHQMGRNSRQQTRQHSGRVNDLDFSTDGQFLLSSSDDGNVILWDRDGNYLTTYSAHQAAVLDASFTADGKHFASVGLDSSLIIWKRESKVLLDVPLHERAILSATFSPDQQYLFTATSSGEKEAGFIKDQRKLFKQLREAKTKSRKAYIIDAESGTLIRELTGHELGINDIVSGQDLIVTAGDDGKLIIRNIKGDIQQTLIHGGAVQSIAVSPDQQQFVSVGLDQRAILWNRVGEILDTLQLDERLSSVLFDPNGQLIYLADFAGQIKIWDRQSRSMDSLKLHADVVWDMALSSDGKYLLTASSDNTAILFDIPQKRRKGTFTIDGTNQTGAKRINCVSFSPDDQYFLIGSEGGIARLFNLQGQAIQSFQLPQKMGVYSVAFSPTGRRIFVGYANGQGKIYSHQLLED